MTPQRNEECRNEVLTYLAQRQGIAQSAATIHRRVNRENNFTIAEVEAALGFLRGFNPPLVRAQHDELGSSQFWQVTSEGVLHYERSL